MDVEKLFGVYGGVIFAIRTCHDSKQGRLRPKCYPIPFEHIETYRIMSSWPCSLPRP